MNFFSEYMTSATKNQYYPILKCFLLSKTRYLMMDSARNEKELFCRALVGFSSGSCLVNLVILTLLCHQQFRKITINLIICLILLWDIINGLISVVQCFEKSLSSSVFWKLPAVMDFFDNFAKKMLFGTVFVFVFIRTISIISPFSVRNLGRKMLCIGCLLPMLLSVPSLYYIVKGIMDSNKFDKCPMSFNSAHSWDEKITESKNSMVRISFDLIIYLLISGASIISMCSLLTMAKSAIKVKATVNILAFLIFWSAFFFPHTAFEMVQECVRFDQFVEKQHQYHDFQSLFGRQFQNENQFLTKNDNKSAPYSGSYCWFMTGKKPVDNFFMDFIHLNRKMFVNSFYAVKSLEVVGKSLLGLALILPSSVYREKIKLFLAGCKKNRG